MDTTYQQAQFIRAIIPTELEPHERLMTVVKFKDAKSMSQYATKDIYEHLTMQEKFDVMSHADVYTSLQSYDSSTWKPIAPTYIDRTTGEEKPTKRAGQLNPKRTGEHVNQIKSFWFDIDGKEIPKSGILQHVEDTFDETGFTAAGLQYIAVDSGGGYHIYIPLNETITKVEWKPIALALDQWITPLLKADPGVSNDMVRILRMPGMQNKKQADGKRKYPDHTVEVAKPIDDHDDDGNWELNNLDDIQSWIKSQGQKIPHVAKVNTQKPAMTDGTASKVLNGCQIVKHHIDRWWDIHKDGGTYDDRWQHIMGAVLYSDDAEEALRKALPTYTAGLDNRHGSEHITETLTRKRNMGYKYSCSTLREHDSIKAELPDACQGCRLQPICYAKPSDLALLPSDTERNVGSGTDLKQFTKALELLGYDLRFNTRADRPEFRQFDNDWEPVNPGFRARLQTDEMQTLEIDKEVKGNVKPVPYQLPQDKFKLVLDANAYQSECDPFMDYLDGLPDLKLTKTAQEWLTHPHWKIATPPLLCDQIFTELLGHQITADDELGMTEADELRWHCYVSRFLTLAAVHRTYAPGCKVDEVPVISGPQGLGKDLTIEQLLPKIPNQDLYTNSFSFKQSEKERMEATNGAVIVAASEMAGVTRSDDVESMKSWITRRQDKGRMSYRHDAEVFHRRFIVTCTTNINQPLPQDASGNRRWLVVHMTHDKSNHRIVPWFNELIDDPRFDRPMSRRDIIWTEAKALYKASEDDDITVPDYIRGIQRRKNEGFEHTDLGMEDAWSQYGHNIRNDEPITSKGVALALNLVRVETEFTKNKSMQYRVADLMAKHGFIQKNRSWHFRGCDKPFRGKAWIKSDHPIVLKKQCNDEFDYGYFYGDLFVKEFGGKDEGAAETLKSQIRKSKQA